MPDIEGFECAGLNAGYGDIQIVSDFSLKCERGEIVAIIGPNGSGKSTLLKRIAGLLRDRGGTVRLGNENLTNLSPEQIVRHGMYYVPQVRDVFPSLTVKENLLMGIANREKLDAAIETFPELQRLLHRMAGRLSGGERKMLGIARALMMPQLKVILLDEPSAGLSPLLFERIWVLVQTVAALNIGLVVVEQQVGTILSIANRGYVMVAGHQQLQGTGEDLRARDDLGDIFVGRPAFS